MAASPSPSAWRAFRTTGGLAAAGSGGAPPRTTGPRGGRVAGGSPVDQRTAIAGWAICETRR